MISSNLLGSSRIKSFIKNAGGSITLQPEEGHSMKVLGDDISLIKGNAEINMLNATKI